MFWGAPEKPCASSCLILPRLQVSQREAKGAALPVGNPLAPQPSPEQPSPVGLPRERASMHRHGQLPTPQLLRRQWHRDPRPSGSAGWKHARFPRGAASPSQSRQPGLPPTCTKPGSAATGPQPSCKEEIAHAVTNSCLTV